MGSAVLLVVLLSALHVLWTPGVRSQGLPESNGVCGEDGCFAVYFQRKTFLEAWRSCKEKGGNLATMKRAAEAGQVEELLAGAERRVSRAKVRVWIGLQRQPRQCSAASPLRGFSWTTGDKDTQYTNWLREDSPSTCSAPRCVVTTHSTAGHERQDNYKWLDGSCSLPVDGFLCRFVYEKGMCQALPREGGAGPVFYSTPFNLLSTRLTHIPFGSVATVPCLDGDKGDQSVLCLSREDGSAGWHQDGPYCTDPPPKRWCQDSNGGCQHLCFEDDDHYYCECHAEFRLAEDGHACVPLDPCQNARCEHECLPSSEGYRCTCPHGYRLAPDGLRCQDRDECLDDPCEQACENSPGSYVCHCHLGFFPLPEDPTRCQDVDECQIPGSCEHMCVNYVGGFQCHCREGYELQLDYSSCRPVPNADESPTATPSFPWLSSLPENSWSPQIPDFPDQPPQLPEGYWPTEAIPQDWLTDQPRLEGQPTDLTRPTDVPVEEHRGQVKEDEQEQHSWLAKQEEQDRQDEQYGQEEQDRQDEHHRQEEQYRQEEQDRQDEQYGQEEQDRQDEHHRQEEQYRQEEQDRQREQDRQEEQDRQREQDRQEEQDRQDEHHRQEEQYRQEEQDRQREQYGQEEEDSQEEQQVHTLPEEVLYEHEKPDWSPDEIVQSWTHPDWVDQDQQAHVTTPSATSNPDWLENETTPRPTAPPTPPPEDYLWSLLGYTFPPWAPEESIERQETPEPQSEEGSHSQFENGEAAPTWYPTSGPQVEGGVIFDNGLGDGDEAAPGPFTPEPGADDPPHNDGSKQQSNMWLLIALLVPFCIFLVVMVVLGIVYCTRCTARARNKDNKDCYHWISGANDKPGAPGAAAKV